MTKVLLVEDDNNLREIYEARLAAEGYDISAAQDGEEALEAAKKVQPDLIISDVMMPRISGFEMLDILRNTQGLKHTKVIMLTALGQEEDKTRADSLGADRYLVKSQVTLEDIVKAADELLNGADAPEESADTPAAAPQPQQSDLSPTAPPAVAAAAHSTVGAPSAMPQQPLSSFEDTTAQPTPTTTSSAGEPIVGGPAPVTTATVASDPLASNDQTLQDAAQALSAQPAISPAAAPVVTPVAPAPVPADPAPAPAPTVPAVTPAVIDPAPSAEPASTSIAPVTAPEQATPVEQTAPPLVPQPVDQTIITPPEVQPQQPPTLPEIERAMEATTAAAPKQATAAPDAVAPAAPESVAEPVTAPQTSAPGPVEQPPADFTRPSIGGTTPASAPDVALPEAQTTAQEAATVTDQINNFTPPQFPANVGEIVEAPGSPDAMSPPESVAATPVAEPVTPTPAEQPAATPEMPTSLQPVAVEQPPADPMAAASAPSPSSLPPTGGQRTIQPLVSTTPQVDINQLAAQEGSVSSPTDTPGLAHQPGGVFTPDQSGSAADAAL